MLQTAQGEQEREILKGAVTQLILKNITSAGTNDTLLHLSVSRLNYIKHDIVGTQLISLENLYFNRIIIFAGDFPLVRRGGSAARMRGPRERAERLQVDAVARGHYAI